jgi:hypothetical protein
MKEKEFNFLHLRHPMSPLIHAPTFINNLTVQPRILVAGVYALATRYVFNSPLLSPARLDQLGEEYYSETKKLVDKEMESPNVNYIRALILLALYNASRGKGKFKF